MNSELRSVLLYIRGDIVQIRHRCHPSSSGKQPSSSGKQPVDDMRGEMTDLMRSVVSTIDDIVSTGMVIWNSLFLMHLIHVFTVQLKNIDDVHKAADSIGLDIFAFDVDHTRVICHLRTILSVCQSNLAALCGGTAPQPRRSEGGGGISAATPADHVLGATARASSPNRSRAPSSDGLAAKVRASSPDRLRRASSDGSSVKLKRVQSTRNTIPITHGRSTSPMRVRASSMTSSLDLEPLPKSSAVKAATTMDPLVVTKLNEMNRLARRCTSRNLMDIPGTVNKALGEY
jgi:hypothetical protein